MRFNETVADGYERSDCEAVKQGLGEGDGDAEPIVYGKEGRISWTFHERKLTEAPKPIPLSERPPQPYE
jgi:hypothetical protein